MDTAGIRRFLVLLSTIKLLDGSGIDLVRVAPQGPITVNTGATVRLNCSVNTNIIPAKNMFWEYSPNLASKVATREMLNGNLLQIIISKVSLGDSGTIKCLAKNQYGHLQFKEVKLSVLADNDSACTGAMQYRCASGECIYQPFRCDTIVHCEDASDEIGCTPSCSEGFLCGNNNCIGARQVCDRFSENNCGDWSDESNCMFRRRETTTIVPEDPRKIDESEDEMDWLRTTVYTAVGCIIAMVLIIAILIVAILRIRMKREAAQLATRLRRSPIQTVGHIGQVDSSMSRESTSPYTVRSCPPSMDAAVSDTYESSEATIHAELSSLIDSPPPYQESDPHIPRDESPPPPYATMEGRHRTSRRQRSEDGTRTQRKERRHHPSPRISPRVSPRGSPRLGTLDTHDSTTSGHSGTYVPMLYEVSL